jgi:uncharacterized membrane protein YhhN
VVQLVGPLALFAAAALLALIGAGFKLTLLFRLTKALPALLLIAVVGQPQHSYETLVVVGLILSAAGDIALLWDEHQTAFFAAIGLVLLAHIAYAGAFLSGAGPTWTPVIGLVIFGMSSAWLVRQLIPGAGPAFRLPLLAYGAAITAMVASAFATLAGPWPVRASAAAALGAMLFYFSDAHLGWTRFRRAYPQSQLVTLGLYWTGQLGIALAVRWARG